MRAHLAYAEQREQEIREEEERKAAEEAAARAAAERRAQRAAELAALYAGPGYAEEWEEEEWWEEESEYEYAAYHPGAKGQEEAHVEEGLLYQPLDAESGGEAAGTDGSARVRLCTDPRTDAMVSCARYASLLGEIGKAWHWVKHHVHKLIATAIAGVSTVVIVATGALATSLCGLAAGEDPLVALDCGKIGAMTEAAFTGGITATIEAWKDTKN